MTIQMKAHEFYNAIYKKFLLGPEPTKVSLEKINLETSNKGFDPVVGILFTLLIGVDSFSYRVEFHFDRSKQQIVASFFVESLKRGRIMGDGWYITLNELLFQYANEQGRILNYISQDLLDMRIGPVELLDEILHGLFLPCSVNLILGLEEEKNVQSL